MKPGNDEGPAVRTQTPQEQDKVAVAIVAGLAQEINAEHAAAHADARSGLERRSACGELLLQVKAQTAHGAWLPWIDANLTFGARQAQKYIRLAESWDRLPNANSDSLLPSIDAALATVAEARPAPSDMTAEYWAERINGQVFGGLLAFANGCLALREIRDLMQRSPDPFIGTFERYSMKLWGLKKADISRHMAAAEIFDAMGRPQTVEAFREVFERLGEGSAAVIWEAMLPMDACE